MFKTVQLSPSKLSEIVHLENFRAAAVFVANPTGSAIVLGVGRSDIPTLANADHRIGSNGYLLVPAAGADFTVAFADQAAITAPATSNLQTAATITFLDETEKLPSFGAASFLNLSLADLTNGFQAWTGVTTSPTFDLGSWGGAVALIQPSPSSGQGVATVQVSSNATNWSELGSWAFWPGVPLTLIVPRTVRYARLVLNTTNIPGEPAISGQYAVRASLAEINQAVYVPGSGSLSRPYAIGALGSQSIILCTANLPGLSIGVNNAAGAGGMELILEASSSPLGPWRLVNFREQGSSGFYATIYRSLGDLDLFTRATVLDLGGTGLTGTFVASPRGSPDETSYLQSIYAALGDVGQPVNANQSIYHVLQTSRTSLGQIQTSSTQIQTNTAGTVAQLATIDARIANIEADIDQILINNQRLESVLDSTFNCPGVGTFNTGLTIPTGARILLLHFGVLVLGLATGRNDVIIYLGTAGAPTLPLDRQIMPLGAAAASQVVYLSHPIGGGISVPVGNNTVWVYQNAGTNVDVYFHIVYT